MQSLKSVKIQHMREQALSWEGAGFKASIHQAWGQHFVYNIKQDKKILRTVISYVLYNNYYCFKMAITSVTQIHSLTDGEFLHKKGIEQNKN